MHHQEKEIFAQLLDIAARLRGPQGCLWDKKQTLKSMIPNILEEAEEVKAAIEAEDQENLCEELGDLLFDILMVIQIAREQDFFDFEQVLSGAREKFIRRHPHVFGDVSVNTSEEALHVWKEMKRKEKSKQD